MAVLTLEKPRSQSPAQASGTCRAARGRCICNQAMGLLVAEWSEASLDCPHLVRLTADRSDLIRRLNGSDVRLTTRAKSIVAPSARGGANDSLADLISMRRLALLNRQPARPIFSAQRRKPAPPPVEAVPPPVTEKGWIKFKVVHHSTGEPYVGVRLAVRLPNGAEFDYQTSRDGIVAIDEIDSGSCDVWCSLKGARIGKTVGFVGMGAPTLAPATLSGFVNPTRPTAEWIAEVVEHKVQTGQTLAGVAAMYDYSWRELAEFNWCTSVPDEINKHLRDDVGCTVKTPDGFNYRFNNSDEPGVIYVPKPWTQEGLATEQTHVIRVKVAAGFRLILENQDELRIPEAEYEVKLSNGNVRKGRLGRSGVALIKDPPPGRVEVHYPDLDDIEAKSLAACAHLAVTTRELPDLFRVMKHEPWMLRLVINAYEQYYNDHTGCGLLADIEQETTDPDDRGPMSALYWIGELTGEPSVSGSIDADTPGPKPSMPAEAA